MLSDTETSGSVLSSGSQQPSKFHIMLQRIRRVLFRTFAALLSVFVLAEVNYPQLSPQGQLAIFAMFGLVLVFLKYPIYPRFEKHTVCQILDFVFALVVVVCFGYILVQTEPVFKRFWVDGQRLGDRAGMGTPTDYIIGLLGLLLVLEGTRRAIGLTLCLLSLAFLAYAAFGQSMPDWLFPHRGYSWERIVSQTFLHSQGGVWHRLEGDVHLRIPLRLIWCVARENRSHWLHYQFCETPVSFERWRSCQSCCRQQWSDGFTLW